MLGLKIFDHFHVLLLSKLSDSVLGYLRLYRIIEISNTNIFALFLAVTLMLDKDIATNFT
jgi:hypothetical protein